MTYLITALILLVIYTGWYNLTEVRITYYLSKVSKIKSSKYKLVGHDVFMDGFKIMRFDGVLYRFLVKYESSKRLKICDDLRGISNGVKRNA